MEPTVSSETSAIRTQTPGNYPKENKLHLEHDESLKTRIIWINRTLGQVHIPLYASYADIPKINYKIFPQNSAIPERLKDVYNSVFETENSTQMLFLFPLIANSEQCTSHHLTLSTSQRFTFLPANFYQWEERAMPENFQSSKCFFLSPRNSSTSSATPLLGLFRFSF